MYQGGTYEREHSHEDIASDLWEKSQKNEVICRIKNKENLQEVMDSFENINEAFMKLDVIVCSDGRVLPATGAKMGLAGEGILLSQEELDRFIAKYRGKIAKVTSHEDCGAAKKAFDQNENATGKPDDLGISFAQWLAKQLGATFEHISMLEMRSKFHDERAICFDGTGKFNPAALSKMPGHFVSSGLGFELSEEYMKKELDTLTGIALGDHGFGNKFTEKDPFYIIISAKDAEQLTEMEVIAKDAVAKFGDKVAVMGFVHEIAE